MLFLCLFVYEKVMCQTEEKSGVSGSIRSIKMCSCAQCAMQEKSVWCRAVPCLAHVEQEPDPSTQSTPPPLLICLATGKLVY
jgi:hypothetical protein